ncbi:MAG: imidazoleglycerol-phosphate dehydratase HisB [Thermoplasmata archaeon]
MRRKTEEVEMVVELNADGMEIETGDEVLDHMLKTMFFYMEKDVYIEAEWDLKHHLWEDMGITIGKAMEESIEGKNIGRFGNSIMPMDDALVLVSVDISRSYLNIDLDHTYDEEGFQKTLVKELLNGIVRSLSATIHVKKLDGEDKHHIIEAAFKGLGVSFKSALGVSDRIESTKGSI